MLYSQPSDFPTFKGLGLYVPGGSRKNPGSPWVQPSHVLRDGKIRVINRETDSIYVKARERFLNPRKSVGAPTRMSTRVSTRKSPARRRR